MGVHRRSAERAGLFQVAVRHGQMSKTGTRLPRTRNPTPASMVEGYGRVVAGVAQIRGVATAALLPQTTVWDRAHI